MGTFLSERLDTNRAANDGIGDGVITSADPIFFIATDLSGKRIETYRSTDAQPRAVVSLLDL